jgi:hypothetical protein
VLNGRVRGAAPSGRPLLLAGERSARSARPAPVEHLLEGVRRVADAMVGDPALREVVGADLGGAVAGADLEPRSRARSASCSAMRRSSRRERSTPIALSLFLCCDFSSWQVTTSPLGRWVMRTAESVVFTDCPPGRRTGRRRSSARSRRSARPPPPPPGARPPWRRRCGCAPALRGRDALHPVHARLVAQVAVGVGPADDEDRLLHPPAPLGHG